MFLHVSSQPEESLLLLQPCVSGGDGHSSPAPLLRTLRHTEKESGNVWKYPEDTVLLNIALLFCLCSPCLDISPEQPSTQVLAGLVTISLSVAASQERVGTSTELKLTDSSVLASRRSISPSLSRVLTRPGTLLHIVSNITCPVLQVEIVNWHCQTPLLAHCAECRLTPHYQQKSFILSWVTQWPTAVKAWVAIRN